MPAADHAFSVSAMRVADTAAAVRHDLRAGKRPDTAQFTAEPVQHGTKDVTLKASAESVASISAPRTPRRADTMLIVCIVSLDFVSFLSFFLSPL
jgi:hypothetical protein